MTASQQANRVSEIGYKGVRGVETSLSTDALFSSLKILRVRSHIHAPRLIIFVRALDDLLWTD